MTQENIDKFNGYLDGFTALGFYAENMVPAFMGGAAPRDDPHVAGLAGDAD